MVRDSRMPIWRNRPWLAYGFAIVAVVAAVAVRRVANGVLPMGYPYITFFPAIVTTAFLAGTGPGLLAAVLSFFASWYFFVPPTYSFAVTPSTIAAQSFFIGVAGIELALIDAMHRAYARLAEARERMAALYDQQKTLFRELQHRTANNMSFIASILHFQKRAIAADPARAERALDEAQGRIAIMGRVHRRLYDPEALERPLTEHFAALVRDVIAGSDRPDIVYQAEIAEARLDLTQLIALSLFVSEVVTNSLKHAFADRPRGSVTLRLLAVDTGLTLEIGDDGRGLPPGFDPAADGGLGTRIVHGLAEQLRGTLTIESPAGGGALVRLVFPNASPASE